MTAIAPEPPRAKPKSQREVQAQLNRIVAKTEEAEALDTDAVFTELARLLPEYTVESRIASDGEKEGLVYGVRFTVEFPTWTFEADGSPYRDTIREAAVQALKGAYALGTWRV